jgi:hypothetical protein
MIDERRALEANAGDANEVGALSRFHGQATSPSEPDLVAPDRQGHRIGVRINAIEVT